MIRNLYTITSGRYMGQGLIVVEQILDENDLFSAILWPSARLITISRGQLENQDVCQLLGPLPEDVFLPYKTAHDKIAQTTKPTCITNSQT